MQIRWPECPQKPNKKTQTYLISFQSQLYPGKKKKKKERKKEISHLRKQQREPCESQVYG